MSYDIVRPAPNDERLRSVAHALGIIVAAFAAGIALGVAGIEVLAFAGYTDDTAPVLVNVVATVLQYVGFIGSVLGYLAVANEWDLIPSRVPDVSGIAWMIGGFVGVFLASLAVSIVVTALGVQPAENVAITAGRENPALFLWMIPITVLLVGPGEELVFRGVVQGQLKRAYGPIPAIVLASLLFGVVHWVALTGTGSAQFTYIAIAGTLGLVLGIAYEKADNIVVPAVVHGLWNAMLFAINWYVAVSDIPLPA